jgi:hypothetical protein
MATPAAIATAIISGPEPIISAASHHPADLPDLHKSITGGEFQLLNLPTTEKGH